MDEIKKKISELLANITKLGINIIGRRVFKFVQMKGHAFPHGEIIKK